MEHIQITNNHVEIRKLCEAPYDEHEVVYDPRMMKMIYKIINEHNSHASDEEKQDVF